MKKLTLMSIVTLVTLSLSANKTESSIIYEALENQLHPGSHAWTFWGVTNDITQGLHLTTERHRIGAYYYRASLGIEMLRRYRLSHEQKELINRYVIKDLEDAKDHPDIEILKELQKDVADNN